MTTGTGTGGSGSGSGGGSGTGPPIVAQLWDALADVIWSFRVTFALLWQRWSR